MRFRERDLFKVIWLMRGDVRVIFRFFDFSEVDFLWFTGRLCESREN